MSEWQPIETAPRDGTEILVCCTYSLGGDEWETSTWVDYCQPPYEWPVFKNRIDIPCWPMHWMPLPEAPR